MTSRREMPFGRVSGLSKPVSRLVLGVDNQVNLADAAVVFDDFVERGGNAFDTAFVYRGGVCEAVFGQWLESRGVRDDVVVIGKGAHTPHCDPESLSAQLTVSLERLRTDFVDVYLLHRDNPAVPVSAFVDALNDELRAGRVRAFGGSNWSVERVAAANRYAAERGLVGFAALSNNFSLARMVEPVWPGCVSASDAASRAFLEREGLALFAWSSQARGFFVRARPDDRGDAELVRSWYAEDNFERLRRVRALAAARGVPPVSVALAYVLHQPFPVFALIGPRSVEETRSSFEALGVSLSAAERAWLNLERAEPA